MQEYTGESPIAFLAKVRDAALRAGALIVLDFCHWCIGKSFAFFNHFNYKPASVLLEAISYIVFAFLYVYLLWDMVKIFVPWLRPKTYPGIERRKEENAQAK
jgi:hypothetical protein